MTIRYDEAKITHIQNIIAALKNTRRARDELLASTKAKKGCVEFLLSKYDREPSTDYCYSNNDDGKQKLYRVNSEDIAHLLMPIFQGRIRDIEAELVSLNVELPPETPAGKP